MKTKITPLLLTLFLPIVTLYSSSDAKKLRTNSIQTILLLTQGFMFVVPFIASSMATSKKIDLSLLKFESLVKAIPSAIYVTTIKCKFCHLQSPHFLTIKN